ncbi:MULTISPECIES: peptidoglycan-binding protein [Microbacterium]|uniref:peptidoglycan-binding domain-containing protein n=1 Tax=Microbacterium TaxID=33882 RepID=UPI001EF51D39|nr:MULTISPECIES: peptidoglycan-binding protein [Microbacterium]
MPMRLTIAVVGVAVSAVALAACSGDVSDVDRAQTKVTAKENAVADAQDAFTAASDEFCEAAESYIGALDRYGDVLADTAPTVGDVRSAGADLAAPREESLDAARAATEAQAELVAAQQELVDARAELAAAQSGPSGTPAPIEDASPSVTPLAPTSSVNRVEQAEDEFAATQAAITDDTPLHDASEQFNSAAVALEMAWLKLFAETGCLADEPAQQAEAAVRAYTTAIQQELATAGYYAGTVDGIYGPVTVQAVEDLQEAHGLPVTGTVDKATADALDAELAALGSAAAQDSVASTAAVQQTLSLLGFWDGPVDGLWTPELTEAVMAFQVELGVEPTGAVDAATIAAFEQAVADLQQESTPTPSPSGSGG